MGWHGETYCLVGGYRAYGEVPLASPAKVEAEKPVPSRAPKRKHHPEKSYGDLGCPRRKIRRLQHSSSLGLEGALILKQGGPTSGHIPSATAPVNEMSHPYFLKVDNRESPPKEGSLALPLSQRLPPVWVPPVGLISLRAELSLPFSESDQIVLVTPLHSGDRVFHGGCC